jgi:Holliday junction resolvase-like predicted endonuclease
VIWTFVVQWIKVLIVWIKDSLYAIFTFYFLSRKYTARALLLLKPLVKAMPIFRKDTKKTGNTGEEIAANYFIAEKAGTLHFVEVKTISVQEFPVSGGVSDDYNPAMNIHEAKIRHIARTAEWYVAEIDWEGEWQLDAVLVWLRARDGEAQVEHIPQIV